MRQSTPTPQVNSREAIQDVNFYPEKAFDFAAELVKQLITLSTVMIGLTVTFTKDLFINQASGKDWLFWAWILFIISIIFGIATLMGYAGSLDPPENHREQRPSVYSDSNKWPLGCQIATFLGALGFTIVYASCNI